MIENIEKLKNEELVKIMGEKVIGTPSGLDAQHAQAELNRRLIDGINNFNKSTTDYSKRMIAVTIILLVVAMVQLVISIFLSDLNPWAAAGVEIFALGVIIYFINDIAKEFIEKSKKAEKNLK